MSKLTPQLLAALRDLIGTQGSYSNKTFEIIEVLEHDEALVLSDCDESAQSIQPDMHGEAHRKVHKTHTVPIFSELGDVFHPVLQEFFSPDIIDKLSEYK